MLLKRQTARWILWGFMAGLALSGPSIQTAKAADAPHGEYAIKAAFLVNFLNFIEWPEDSLPAGGKPFLLGILGEDPFGEALDELVGVKNAQNRGIEVKRARKLEDLAACHIIFISKSEQKKLESIVDKLDKQPILTVTDLKGGANKGAIINFIIVKGKIKFEINNAAAQAVDLKISSKLLKLATIIEP